MEERMPYLIQRCRVRSRENITGIDSLLSFDYMGSSEFEWGALPIALRELCEVADELMVHEVSFTKKKSLWLVTTNKDVAEARRMLKIVSSEKARTKEYVGIEAYLKGTEAEHSYRDYKAWWDIDHHWIACVDKELAELVIKAIKSVRDRRKANG